MRKIVLLSCLALFLSSCVSSKIHKDLQAKYKDLQQTNTGLRSERDSLSARLDEALQRNKDLKLAMADLQSKNEKKEEELSKMMDKYRSLNRSYEGLLQNNNELLSSSQKENEKLTKRLAKLQRKLGEKEDSLRREQQELATLRTQLEDREKRVNELEQLIAQKDSTVNAVRAKLKDALLNFDGKGLTVQIKDGKVYVSLENSLLFSSGSWEVEQEGENALDKLAQVLAENPDLNVMVEGHTDSDAYYGGKVVQDNWDLSVMRATSVVKILTQNPDVEKSQIIAAGRSEYLPVASNDSSEGKAQNRRIEIIITPDLSELSDLLSQTN